MYIKGVGGRDGCVIDYLWWNKEPGESWSKIEGKNDYFV